MSSDQIVRKPCRVRERSSRTLDQLWGIRFPKVPRLTGRLLSRLPPSSQLRQAALWRAVRLNAEAFNRQDFEAVLLNYGPAEALVAVGLREGDVREGLGGRSSRL